MKIEIKDNFITDDSNECKDGCYFLKNSQNLKFVEDAKKNGAIILNFDELNKILNIDKNIKIVGITGTNGKTTTANLIAKSLQNLGFNVVLCGTRGAFLNEKQFDEKGLTTSCNLKIFEYLKIASENKCDFLVMEVSSHAIAQNRIDGIKFWLKIFTNLTQDHLDFHKTFENYVKVKSSFFSDDCLKIINKDDKFIKYNQKNSYTYSLKNDADFSVLNYDIKDYIKAKICFKNDEISLKSLLVGKFNLYNLLASFAAAKLLTNYNSDEIAKSFENFQGVEGRVEIVHKNPLVIVDFAHTPDGIEKVLKAFSKEKIICVFGAGGDRDNTKRPIMGKIAQNLSQICIVTSDNPRNEDPNFIIKQILKGMQKFSNVIVQEDRKKAIFQALDLAKNGEIVVILGKGDETYQEIKGVKYHFSDKEIVKEYYAN